MNYNHAPRLLWGIGAMTLLVTAIPAGAQGLPEGKGKEQFERICRNCHPVDVATRTRHDKDGWAGVVEDMVARGAQGKQDDLKQVVDYLSTNFGPNNPTGSTSPSAAAPTPAAPPAPKVDESASKPGDAAHGKAVYTANGCSGCHQIGQAGSRVGPDLTEIGGNRSYEQLQKAIVTPDDEVLPENRSARVVLKDGTTVTGRLLNQDGFSVQLIDSKEQLRSFLRSELREYTILTKGLMPSYSGKLSPSDVADLTKYLASLKGDSKP